MIFYSILTLFGLGLLAAVILAVASRVFYVEEDPRVEAVLDALPGANCGGCGYAGCEGYATAVINDPSVPASLCCAGSNETCIVIGELTGKAACSTVAHISFRRCEKISGEVVQRYEYQGMPSCAAAALLVDGIDACSWSCLGYGDCVQVCPFDAMNIENRMATINSSICTGCGICISACPRNSLTLVPVTARIGIHCGTHDKMRTVMDVCKVGCINCGKCIKVCPAKAISQVNDRVEIDHQTCLSYGPDCAETCVDSCPRKILRLECNAGIQLKTATDKAKELAKPVVSSDGDLKDASSSPPQA